MLPRELDLPAPADDAARWCDVRCLDRRGAREEILRTSSASDVYPGAYGVDPRTGVGYECRMRRSWPGHDPFTYDWGTGAHPCADHCFVVEPLPGGGHVERLLRYEDGPDWDPHDPFAPAFLAANRAYFGNGFAFGGDGVAYLPLVCQRQAPGAGLHGDGLVLMRRDPTCGAWSASNRVHIAARRSSRGLLEPDAAVLADGAVLVIARGSHTATTPGRKWVVLSRDGGRTLGPVDELRDDDGGRFDSPSSIHRLLRSSRNGRLYWLANIVPEPPAGNGPRYPLFLAEIDEATAAVRRASLVRVDDRGPGDGEGLQLSNFAFVEDPETGRFEIYLTRLGQDPARPERGSVYRYLFAPPAA